MTEDELALIHDWWFRIPLSLRRRWWDETAYNERPPSDDLVQEILKWIKANDKTK